MSEFYVNWAKVKIYGCIQSFMLPWKLQKCQILPVNQNLSSAYFSLAKFQLVSRNLFLAMIWQMTYTHKLPKLCSTTLIGLKHDIWQRSLVYFGYKLKFSCMRVINIFNPRGWDMHVMADIECVTIVVPAYQK